jgi:inner membrane protein
MDPFTHALSGALLARASAPAAPQPGTLPLRHRLAAGTLAALFPDLDLLLRLAGTLTYLNWHQGPTHSLVLLPLWAWLLAWLCARLGSRPATGTAYGWRACYPVCCLGLGIHVAGDLITAYGPMLAAPLSSARHALSLAYVVDAWITGLLAAGLLLALRLRAAHGRVVAWLALAAVGGYLALQAGQQQRALALGLDYAARLGAAPAVSVHALPQPLPGNWMVVVDDGHTFHVARQRLRGAPSAAALPALAGALPAPLREIQAAHRPAAQATWQPLPRLGAPADAAFAAQAWQQPAFEPFRRFASLPVLDHVSADAARRCAWFADLRFSLPGLPTSFRFGMCQDAGSGHWTLQRARGAFWLD